MEPLHHDYEAAEIRNQTAQEAQDFNLFAMLKPQLKKDGNEWCVWYGKDLQSGVSGYGDSPHQAIMDFNSQWYKSLKQQPTGKG